MLGIFPPYLKDRNSVYLKFYIIYCTLLVAIYIYCFWSIMLEKYVDYVFNFGEVVNGAIAVLGYILLYTFSLVVTIKSCLLVNDFRKMFLLIVEIDKKLGQKRKQKNLTFYTETLLMSIFELLGIAEYLARLVSDRKNRENNFLRNIQFCCMWCMVLTFANYSIIIRRRFERFNLLLSTGVCGVASFYEFRERVKVLRSIYNSLAKAVASYNKVFGTHIAVYMVMVLFAFIHITNLVIVKILLNSMGFDLGLMYRVILWPLVLTVSTIVNV